jgi:hypothetical protein
MVEKFKITKINLMFAQIYFDCFFVEKILK